MFLQKPLKPSPQALTCPTPLWAASPTAESLQACLPAHTPRISRGSPAPAGPEAGLHVSHYTTGDAHSLASCDAQLMDEGTRGSCPRFNPQPLCALMQEGQIVHLATIGGPRKPPEDQVPTVRSSSQRHHLQPGNPSEESRQR